jgi:dUTP pyrophosphatase
MIDISVNLDENARCPEYQSDGSAGADLFASNREPVIIEPGETVLVPTGIRMEIPEGYEGQIRPRSGLALKHGITLLNSPGTIDSDYRGEVGIIMTNLGKETFTVTHGMRIAQIVFTEVYRARFNEKGKLNNTNRNEGGFGHTGI